MNKLTAYLGGFVYAESMPEWNKIKLYTDVGGAQEDVLFLGAKQITALWQFLREIEEGE